MNRASKIMRTAGLVLTLCALWTCGEKAFSAPAEPVATAELLPEMSIWRYDEPMIFHPEDLFEYINGAADVYLSYGFEELAARAYDLGDNSGISVEIYRLSDLRNAFGIYSQEKPQKGNFIEVGAEGYYEKGMLNFFRGPYYVKIMGFYLEEEDEKFLKGLAHMIAREIGGMIELHPQGQAAFPAALECFPAEGKIPHSERFLAQDVMGHGFLHAAYAADYEIGGRTERLYLIEARDETDAAEMLEKFLEMAGVPAKDGAGGTYRFDDPRRPSAERFNLRKTGRYLWGISENDPPEADALLDAVEANLAARGFIE